MHETESKMTKVNDSPKNRGAMIGGAVTALLVAGGFATLTLSGQSGERGAQKSGAPSLMLAQVDPGGDLGTAGGTTFGAPAPAPGTPKQSDGDKQALKSTSFRGMPDAYAAATGGGGGGLGGGGFSAYSGGPGGFAAAGGAGNAAATPGAGTDWTKLKKHITRNKTAPGARNDPFVSYRFPGVQKLPAYLYITHMRVASIPEPPPPPVSTDPDLQYGPLPFVPRRVAGILYNGSVSAILEIGNPGSGAEVFIVRPGDKVPSAIPGIEELTVTSISPTQLILRADDGRTTTVALSGAPELQGQTGGAPGGGFPGGGPPGGGFPGGGGFSGGGGSRPGLGGAGVGKD